MSRANKTNVAASVKARLMNRAQETGSTYGELLQLYAMERFLYRLSQSDYANQFVLKGALLFAVWGDFPRRTTMDIDLLGFLDNSLETLEEMAKAVCAIPSVDDGVVFDSKSVKAIQIKENADYEGVRLTISAFLERTRQPIQIDVAFGDSLFPDAVKKPFPVLLDFPAPELRCYHPLTSLAEKFEAMVKLGTLNSRMKDFYDVWLILNQSSYATEDVLATCKATFENRGTPWVAEGDFFTKDFAASSEKQIQWKAFCRKQKLSSHVPNRFQELISELHAFFIPLIKR